MRKERPAKCSSFVGRYVNMAKVSLKKAAELLLEQDEIVILCHRYPDGDTIGSAFGLCMALRDLGKRANVLCGDIIPHKYSYIFAHLTPMDIRERYIVSVDVADPALLGLLQSEYADRIDLCIDHHSSNRIRAKHSYVDANAAATGEIIYKLVGMLGTSVTREIATALYTALSTDTGCFRYSNVTAQTHRIAAKLLEAGVDGHYINQTMFETKSMARFRLEMEMLSAIDFRCEGRLAMTVLTKEMMERIAVNEGDIDGLSAMARNLEGVDMGIMIREVADGYKLSVRTSKAVNACDFCRIFGGGGHPAAAGCTIRTDSVEEVKQLIVENAEKIL